MNIPVGPNDQTAAVLSKKTAERISAVVGNTTSAKQRSSDFYDVLKSLEQRDANNPSQDQETDIALGEAELASKRSASTQSNKAIDEVGEDRAKTDDTKRVDNATTAVQASTESGNQPPKSSEVVSVKSEAGRQTHKSSVGTAERFTTIQMRDTDTATSPPSPQTESFSKGRTDAPPIPVSGTKILTKPQAEVIGPSQEPKLSNALSSDNQTLLAALPTSSEQNSGTTNKLATQDTASLKHSVANPSEISRPNHAVTKTQLPPSSEQAQTEGLPSKMIASQSDIPDPTSANFVEKHDAPSRPPLIVPIQSNSPPSTKPTVSVKTSSTTPLGLDSSQGQKAKDSGLSFLTTIDVLEMTSWEGTKLTTTAPATPLRADLAPHIARQLGEAMTPATNRPIEIALSPEELGRVRMSIVTDDGSITVNIIAERADTLDLMRRHIDQLGQTFREMGYDQIKFAFGQGANGGDQAGSGNTDSNNDPNAGPRLNADESERDSPILIDLSTAPDGGVDIRL